MVDPGSEGDQESQWRRLHDRSWAPCKVPPADTVTSPPWWKRREHGTLHLGAKNCKVLHLSFKTTMPSLLDTSIKSLICLPSSWVPRDSVVFTGFHILFQFSVIYNYMQMWQKSKPAASCLQWIDKQNDEGNRQVFFCLSCIRHSFFGKWHLLEGYPPTLSGCDLGGSMS